jgi:hypothetical protein
VRTSSMRLLTTAALRGRPRTALASAASLVALAVGAAVPAGASAVGAQPATASAASVSALPTAEVESVLSGVPLKDLSATQLGALLAQAPGLSALPAGSVRESLVTTIEGLAASGDTLGQAVSSPELISNLETKLNGLLSLPQLLSLLNGHTLSSVLSNALGSPEPSQLLGGLLTAAPEPERLIGQVLAASPEKLDALLGTTLSGEPFTVGTVGGLASSVGATSEGLAGDLNTTTSQLPSSAMALTAPLANGKLLGVLNGLEGVKLGTFGPNEKTPAGAGSGGSGGGSSGGAGGAGGAGAGSSGTPAGTTIVMSNSLPSGGGPALGSSAKAARVEIEILSRKVRGDAVTFVVRVPAAGRLTLKGHGVRTVSVQSDQAERVTLRTVLTKTVAASLRRHGHRGVKIKLEVSFKAVAGSSASTTRTVRFG